MHPANYTPDAICRSMGLPAFVDKKWSAPTLRLLLKPSFHPEVCLTISSVDGQAQLSVIALEQALWKQPSPCAMTTWREVTSVSPESLAEIVERFNVGLKADGQAEGRMVVLTDGMPISACLSADKKILQLHTQPYRPEVKTFVSFFIAQAWQSCQNGHVCNALADCGKYVGLNHARKPMPVSQPLFRIAVLGNEDDRSEYLKQLPARE